MDPRIWWYVSRATGLVAWGLAVSSILLGLALSTRALGARPRGPWLLALHRWLGGMTVLFTAAHVGAIIADSFVHFGLADVLVPFASSWKPLPVALGIVSAWLLVAIEITSFQMKRLPKQVWHKIHMTSYVVAVLATAHGLTSGADTANPVFSWSMIAAITGTTFFAAYRRLAPKKPERPRIQRSSDSGDGTRRPASAGVR